MPRELEAKIKEIIQRTYNVKSFRLDVGGELDFKAGQFLSVTLKTEQELKRYLSISSSPTEKGYIEFTKKLTQSDFSRVLDSLKPQDSVKVQYPFGKFTLDEASTKIAFLSGGIGITPIRSICKYAVDKNMNTDIILIYSNSTFNDIAFREDFGLMQKQDPKLKVIHVLYEGRAGFECKIGRINKEIIKENIPDYLERKFYLCGPPGMVEAMKNILASELAVVSANIITENFQGY
jgi:ferredoxin-NADP reductase